MAGAIVANAQVPYPAAGIVPAMATTNQPSPGGQAGAQVPFRIGSPEKTLILDSQAKTMLTTSLQLGPDTVNGEGYVQEIDIRVAALTAANAATVAFTEDGRLAALASVIFNGPGGDIINCTGPELAFFNQYDGLSMLPFGSSTDVGLFLNTTGAGATGGSFVSVYRLPFALGYRALVGMVGNQDKATKYRLRNDLNASGNIYSTPPTNLPGAGGNGNVQVTRYYRERAVPAAIDNYGNPQAQQPDGYGVIRYIMSEVNQTIPAPGSIRHYFQGLGNTFRTLVLVLRQNNSRASAEATVNTNQAPMSITWFLGDTPLFSEDWALRRRYMFDRAGFDAPAGVLVYSFKDDFATKMGEELGSDFLATANLVTMSVQFVYPAGIGVTSNSLTVVKDSLYIPGNVAINQVLV